MNILITLDYELFFGSKVGSVDKCIIEPTNAILEIVDPFDIKLCVFVDVGFLLRLKKFYGQYPELKLEYNKVVTQIKRMSNDGHDIQLHVHPHWEDCEYEQGWKMDLTRYRLDMFSIEEINDIIFRYKTELEQISSKPVFAYRAGGWSIQPFSKLTKVFKKNGITLDSTVFQGGFYVSNFQNFNFLSAPKNKSVWRFEEDPAIEDVNGSFLEVPIASIKYPPFFYWKFAWNKFKKSTIHNSYGDGVAVANTKWKILELMMKWTHGVVSIDGYKASALESSYKIFRKKKMENLVLIGHPKAFSEYSLNKTKKFIENHNDERFCTYRDYI